MTELFYSDATPEAIRRANVHRCLALVQLGHSDAALRLMGFADGCIRAARRFVDCEAGPYGAQNHPLDMTRPGDVIHE